MVRPTHRHSCDGLEWQCEDSYCRLPPGKVDSVPNDLNAPLQEIDYGLDTSEGFLTGVIVGGLLALAVWGLCHWI